jgi:DNA-binding LacI/PurR family transcriptional regulator
MNHENQPSRVSMRDLAKRLGVSHVTVSLALRDNPRISESMRRQIREMAESMGYRPDPMLAALANYRREKGEKPVTSALAWINAWPEPAALRSFKEFECYWVGASKAAEKHGYRLEEFRLGEQYTPKRLHQILSTRGIRGILLPPHSLQPDWGDFPWAEYSVVRFGRSISTPRCHVVTADHVANTMLAFERIRERGYRRIGFVTDETDLKYRGHLFEGGYLTAQRLVDPEERLPVFTLNDIEPHLRSAELLGWLKSNQVDAIITNLAAVPDMLDEVGIRVPDDVALATTTLLDTTISAGIDQHPVEVGRVGFLMLKSLLNDGSRGVPEIFRQNLVEGSWVDGDSVPDRSSEAVRKAAR